MRKRYLIFPLIICSIFIPSIESVTINDSFENEYKVYQALEIASGGNFGGIGSNRNSGGIMTVEQKKRKMHKKCVKKYSIF